MHFLFPNSSRFCLVTKSKNRHHKWNRETTQRMPEHIFSMSENHSSLNKINKSTKKSTLINYKWAKHSCEHFSKMDTEIPLKIHEKMCLAQMENQTETQWESTVHPLLGLSWKKEDGQFANVGKDAETCTLYYTLLDEVWNSAATMESS